MECLPAWPKHRILGPFVPDLSGFSVRESFLASLFFACHPVHVEAVASLAGRAQLLAALMTIWSLLHILVPLLWPLSFVLAAGALFCKEAAANVALPLCSFFQLIDCMSRQTYSRWKVLKALPPLPSLPPLFLLLLLPLRHYAYS